MLEVDPNASKPMNQFTLIRRVSAAAVVVVAAALGSWWMLGPGPGRAQPLLFDVAPGSGRRAIAAQLAQAGVIHGAWGFEAWCLLHPRRTLKAGTYRLVGNQSVPAVFAMMARGQFFTLSVVIPEGFDRFDIARTLQDRGLAASAAFLRATGDPRSIRDLDPAAVSLEGYLFPATYQISPHASVAEIVAMMTARFRQELRRDARLAASAPDPAPGSPTFHRWITISSMVEKETPAAAERPLIAGIFDNRLARHLRLECDPTVVYAALLAGRYTGALHRADLAFDSPYNTYRHAGLPPGPIANPGHQSLMAALHPAATDFLYFVSNGHGAHRFARTLGQQKRNIQLYLRTLRQH